MEPQASMECSAGHFQGRLRGYGRGPSRGYSICCTLRWWGRTQSSEWDGTVLTQLCLLRQASGLLGIPANASWEDKGWEAEGLVSPAVCYLSLYLADIYSWPTWLCLRLGFSRGQTRLWLCLGGPSLAGDTDKQAVNVGESGSRPEGPLLEAGRLRLPLLKKGGEQYSREKEQNVRMPRGPRAVQSRDCSLVSGEWEWCLKKRTRLYLMGPWQPPHSTYVVYWSNAAAAAKSLQSCPTLCDPIDSSPTGSSIHGVFQARVLEWGAIAFSNEEWLSTIVVVIIQLTFT